MKSEEEGASARTVTTENAYLGKCLKTASCWESVLADDRIQLFSCEGEVRAREALGSEGCCRNSKLNSLEDEERAAVQEAGPHLREIRVSVGCFC